MTQKLKGKLGRFGLKKRSTKTEGKQGQSKKEEFLHCIYDLPAIKTSELCCTILRRIEPNLCRYRKMSDKLEQGRAVL